MQTIVIGIINIIVAIDIVVNIVWRTKKANKNNIEWKLLK